MSMREKMARAMYESAPHSRWSAVNAPVKMRPEDFFAAADAALNAMVEPTEGMYEALSATDIIWKNQTSLNVWQNYIRAALAGKSPTR